MKKILIVDDEETILFSFERILTKAGYEVMKAGNLIEAKAILASNLFNVAIVDRLLGADNGLDLVADINKEQIFCSTILISAYPTFQSASDGFKHGLFDYLKKPVKRDELCRTVDAALKKNKEKQKLYNKLS
jgi:DNA-binding NtrC family response regulator